MRSDLELATEGPWLGSGGAEVLEPGSGKPMFALRMGDASAIRTAAASARAAQVVVALPYDDRARVLRTAANLMEADADIYIGWIVKEAGSVVAKAGFEVSLVVKAPREAAAMPSQPQGHVLPTEPASSVLPLHAARCGRCDLAVQLSDVSWPACGCAGARGWQCLVLKPDPRTTVSGGLLLERLFAAAGLPEGVLQVIPGGGDAGEALCTDPDIAMIQFTGSTAVGRKIGALAGGHLKKLSLELGGKNSLIILDDADLDLAAANAAWSAYLHQGQICMAGGRILVQASIHDALAERLVAKANGLPIGDPVGRQVSLGPLINAKQVARALAIIDETVAQGGILAAGGEADGLFFKPSVLTGVTSGMGAFREEIFAPVAVLTKFDIDEDAIALANDADYGLSAGVISSSVGRAMALGAKLRTGLLHINDQTVGDEVVNPFGGRGQSGNGTSIGGPAKNWDEFSQWQMVKFGTPHPHIHSSVLSEGCGRGGPRLIASGDDPQTRIPNSYAGVVRLTSPPTSEAIFPS